MERIIKKNNKIEVSYTGYDKFLKSLIQLAKKRISPNLINYKELGTAMMNHLFDLEGQKSVSRKLSKEDEVFSKLFYGFTEMMNSYENLLDCEMYVRQYPNYSSFKTRNITRTKYLRYHIEKYLEEMYLLKERVIAYAKIIRKYYKSDKNIISKIDEVNKLIFESLKGITKTRNCHTHITRYTDYDLDRLNSLELLCRGKDAIPIFVKYTQKIIYPQIRNKWAKKIKKNNEETKKLLDKYFEFLYELVFNVDGSLKLHT